MAEISRPDYTYQWSSGGSIVAPSNAKIQTGWVAEVPPFQWENWSQNRQDNALVHLFQKGISTWSATQDYYFTSNGVRAYVQGSDGTIYVALQNSTNQNPISAPTYWQPAFVTPTTMGSFAPVVGSTRNARISLSGPSSTATFTADEVVLKSSLGNTVRTLSGISKIINMASVGLGGMDTGTSPLNGSVAIYLVYNPSTALSATNPALLARNSTAGPLPEVYTGANMPAGYTMSALVTSWRTNGAGALVQGEQTDRVVNCFTTQPLSSAIQQVTYVPLSLTASVPSNAKTISGVLAIGSSSVNATSTLALASASSGSGEIQVGISNAPANLNSYASFSSLIMQAPQTIYYKLVSTGTISVGNVYISGYTF